MTMPGPHLMDQFMITHPSALTCFLNLSEANVAWNQALVKLLCAHHDQAAQGYVDRWAAASEESTKKADELGDQFHIEIAGWGNYELSGASPAILAQMRDLVELEEAEGAVRRSADTCVASFRANNLTLLYLHAENFESLRKRFDTLLDCFRCQYLPGD